MTNQPLASWVRSVAFATIVTSVMLSVLIVSAEEIPGLKNWLKDTFSHHWLGKGALALLLFATTTFLFRIKRSAQSLSTYIVIEAFVVAASVGVIAGFFFLHTLGVV